MRGDVKALTAREHGIHLHAAGSCKAPGVASTSEHLDPGHRPHGGPNSMRSIQATRPSLHCSKRYRQPQRNAFRSHMKFFDQGSA
ncbi:MAG: superoxide dismutase family protein [Sphingomonadales bacterium]|nr:superoxide dismutase family protein [Sphingomonadales bacterium]MDE2569139.1 superoxide dismutase family protein [Sphingomonadales bacterium]